MMFTVDIEGECPFKVRARKDATKRQVLSKTKNRIIYDCCKRGNFVFEKVGNGHFSFKWSPKILREWKIERSYRNLPDMIEGKPVKWTISLSPTP